MVDEKLLRSLIEEKGLKYKFVAQQLGITPQGLALKISNINEFTVQEAYKLSDILGLGNGSLNSEIFLPNIDT